MKFHQNNYEHYVKKALPINPDEHFKFVLVDKKEDLDALLSTPQPKVAFDLETTDLNPMKGHIVGVCLSFDGVTGYYIPIKHLTGSINDPEALDKIYRFLTQVELLFVYSRFDLRYMEFSGYDMSVFSYFKGEGKEWPKYYDVHLAIWLADTNVKKNSLKAMEEHFLGFKRPDYLETLGSESSFYMMEPKNVLKYAAQDAVSTWLLAKVSGKFYREAKKSAQLDQAVSYPIMKFEERPHRIRVDILKGIQTRMTDKLSQLEQEIQQGFGFPINISSYQQLSEGLEKIGYHTGKKVASGFMETKIETLEIMNKKYNDPLVGKVIEYKTIKRSLGSYIEKLINFAESGDVRFSYHLTTVPTGRLSSGSGGEKNTFFVKQNLQSTPKPGSQMFYVHPDDSKYSEDEFHVLGHRFYPIEEKEHKSNQVIESYNPRDSIRRAFVIDPGFYWVSIDYSSQELVLPAIFSGEPVWLEAFLNQEDVHKKTAISIWGEDYYNKDLRMKAKIANFSVLYGGDAYTLQDRLGLSESEAEGFILQYKSSLPVLFSWRNRVISEARQTGTVYTYFGRPRRVKFYLNSPSYRIQSFGERTSVNTRIQGTGADILKWAICNLWRDVLNNPKYKDDCQFISTVHDEINFQVRKERVEEIIPILVQCMRVQGSGWPLAMPVGVEIGTSWGFCVPFDLREGRLTLDVEIVKEKGKLEEVPESERFDFLTM